MRQNNCAADPDDYLPSGHYRVRYSGGRRSATLGACARRTAKEAERDQRDDRDYYRDDGRSEPHVIERETVIYRGNDGRYYCHHSDGTTGLIVGAAIGGLIGNRLAPGKSATLDTLLGAGAGALIGQQIDQGSVHCE